MSGLFEVSCPYCKKEIRIDAERCPYCNKNFSSDDRWEKAKRNHRIILLISIIIVIALFVYIF